MKCTVMVRLFIMFGILAFILQVRCENVHYKPLELATDSPLESATDPPLESTTDPSHGSTTDLSLGSTTGPSLGSTTDPSLGSTTDPSLGSTTDPSLGSTTDPSLGSTTDPSLGSTTDPSLGSTTDTSLGRRALRGFQLYEYNSFGDIQGYMEAAARIHLNWVQLQDLGKSLEGRMMKLAKISVQPEAGNPIIFVDAGIHGREWVATAMAMYLFNRLVSDPDAIQIGGMLDGVDWYILPVVNPDGYEYSRSGTKNRLWKKTRSRTRGSKCYGVDGNRNYGFKWAVSGVSNDPCNEETFAGRQAFSEPETRMVSNIMMDNKNRIKLYVSLHSYGQFLVYPWGYTGDFLPKQWKKLDDMARAVSAAVKRAGGKPFKVFSAGKWYPVAGRSDDFAFGAAGIPYSYSMELTEGYDFTFPEKLLPEVLPQFYEGFKEFSVRIRKEFSHQRQNKAIVD